MKPSRPRLVRLASLVFAALVGAAAHACGAPVENDRFIVHAPPSSQFAAPLDETCVDSVWQVNAAGPGLLLDARCGTLDCHGSSQRNMVLYGFEGLRLDTRTDPSEPVPLPGSQDTTLEELVADYHSVVGLEPEILTAVVQDGGARPERLTMIRKARGTESHKGNKLWDEGDDADVCITSWLASNVDKGACARALMAVEPRPCSDSGGGG
jgi:hypothetical protein